MHIILTTPSFPIYEPWSYIIASIIGTLALLGLFDIFREKFAQIIEDWKEKKKKQQQK
jgi:hypothetical protein